MKNKDRSWLILPILCYTIFHNGNVSIDIGWLNKIYTINFKNK